MNAKTPPDWVGRELDRLRRQSLFREIAPVDHGANRALVHRGRRLLNLSSNNYLGLADHPELIEGARLALDAYGTGSGASRLITGNFGPYDALERAVAGFKQTEAALVLGSGYAANVALFTALADRRAVVFSDRLNHASIVDGVRLSGARHVRYCHNDPEHLAKLMGKFGDAEKKIVVTDSVFSMDGDLADIAALAALCQAHGALLVLDEAHAAGVFGQGRGLAHALGLADLVDVHMGTFSKAFGSLGGYLAARRPLIDLVVNKGRPFIFSTALPPAVIGANLAALTHVAARPEAGTRLLERAREMRAFLRRLGFELGVSESQIIPVILHDNARALHARDFLAERGLYVAAVRPPAVPAGTARLRLSLRADLSEADLLLVREGFTALAQELAQNEPGASG